MRKFCTTLLLVCVYGPLSAQQIKLDNKNKLNIYSKSENLERTIYIQLPKDYGRVNKHYPLIVLFDAQDQSLYKYTFSTIDRLAWTNDIPEAIFVGIIQDDRSKELNFEKNETTSLRFLDFLKNDLINYLSEKYLLTDSTRS
ncbi:alpha/beta hydrolase-fold protein [Pedobacter lithocola]|uniref:Alpha/beta hydrolase-fold protein n=1 Tax=Pedobacter lithocola TaxID=1908239 RepID=A0ABV8P6I2_9SPHI